MTPAPCSRQRCPGGASTGTCDEYSTYDWILEGLLRRAGFQIEAAEYAPGFQTTYVCSRP